MTEVNLERMLEGKLETSDSQLVINMPEEKLPVGQHQFQLTVEDNSGNTSQPARITVIIVDSQAPTAVLDLQDVRGRPVRNGRIAFGTGFMLSGNRSSDVGGEIVKYVWEVVPQ